MSPKDFWWDESQQVTVVNPTDKDYRFKVHNKDYQVGAGERVRMPGYIAWVYVYGMSTQLCQADNNFNRWNEEGYRRTYYEKVAESTDDLIQAVEPEVKAETFTPEVPVEEPKRMGRPPKIASEKN